MTDGPWLSRRSLLGRLALSMSLAGIPPGLARSMTNPIVETRAGKVCGAFRDGVYVFKGIRYGASTAAERPPVR